MSEGSQKAARKYRESHREEIRLAMRKYREVNRVKLNQQARKYKHLNKERGKQHYAKNRVARLEQIRVWQKNNPKKVASYVEKHRQANMEKFRARARDWYRANRARALKQKIGAFSRLTPDCQEKYRERQREFYRNNKAIFFNNAAKRRAIKLGASIQPEQIKQWWSEVLSRSFVVCYYCKTTLHSSEAHMEHVIPLKLGGVHGVSNLAISCPPCNMSKGTKMPSMWMRLPQCFLNL